MINCQLTGSLCRFSTHADAGPGSEPFGSARPGHHPQRPLCNTEGETERPLGPSPQRSSLQHGLQPATSAGVTAL